MRLTRLAMKSFAPFADGTMEFPPVEGREGLAEVQMFTGENGTGKTRVLAALMASLGNLNELQDRVRQDSKTELEVEGWSEWWQANVPNTRLDWRYLDGSQDPRTRPLPDRLTGMHDDMETLGELRTTGPTLAGTGWAMAGTGIAVISDAKIALGVEVKPARTIDVLSLGGAVGGSTFLQRLLNLRMSVALERDNDLSNRRLTACMKALEEKISLITGRPFSFLIKPGREIRLMAVWGPDDPIFFSELPDGLRSLINWLAGWVVFQTEHFEESENPLEEPVILILDEPENHLHPAWQRRVLPAVQRLFPKAQMFVVTHSPFVVSSLNEGWIHMFTRGADGLVNIAPPVEAPQGDSYVSATGGILGLAELYDPETERLLAEYRDLRTKALKKEPGGKEAALQLAERISTRGPELAYMMAKEKAQMEKLLNGSR